MESRSELDAELAEYLDVACEAALEGGQILRAAFGNAGRVAYKRKRDPVTQADLAAERAVLAVLTRQFPEHSFVSEEMGERASGAPFCWIVDPLDGTANFVHCLEHFGVSIALLQGSETIVAVVYNPMNDEMYTAVRGHGAFLNGLALRTSEVDSLSYSLLGTGFSASLDIRLKQQQVLGRFLQHCGGVREPGSAALGLCYVARSIYDGYWELGLQPWDVAAGVLLVSEAGGVVTSVDGTRFEMHSGSVLATNGRLHPEAVRAATIAQ